MRAVWMWAALLGAALAEPEGAPDSGLRDEHAWLRAVSLDLRGVVPTPEEHARVGADPDAVEDFVAQWMDEPAFADRVARYHRSLAWNNVGPRQIVNRFSILSVRSGNVYWRPTHAQRSRGNGQFVPCQDRPAVFDARGDLVVTRLADGTLDEGWVEVAPYWAPDTTIKVCAFDAAEQAHTGSGLSCASTDGARHPDCGCGPGLAWCATREMDLALGRYLGEEIDHRVRRIVAEDRPYLELLTGDVAFVNGPMVHFLRDMATRRGDHPFDPPMVDEERLPDLDWTDADTWVPVTLGPEHAGIFTSPAFLVRFQTNRSRTSAFHANFLCQPFVPPSGGLPEAVDEGQTLDLTERAGCQYCHALMEPNAAHWGRWITGGGAYLPPDEVPSFDDACATCGAEGSCDDTCRAWYLTVPLAPEQDPFVGWLAAYEFLEDRHAHHVEEGPGRLVREAVADGRIPACTVSKAADWLLGRPVLPEDRPWIDDLTTGFVASNYDFKWLVGAIVTSENYRRLP